MGQSHTAIIHRTWWGEGTVSVGNDFDTSWLVTVGKSFKASFSLLLDGDSLMATFECVAKIRDTKPFMHFQNCLTHSRSELRIVYSSPFLFTLDPFSAIKVFLQTVDCHLSLH